MTSQENVETVKQGYAAFRAAWTTNDRTPYEAWLRTNASTQFEYVPSADVPGGPTGSLSREEFLHWLDTFWEEFEVLTAEPSEFQTAEDVVLARTIFRGRGRRSGVEVEIDQWQVWRFNDGKAVRGQAFASRAAALEAAGMSR